MKPRLDLLCLFILLAISVSILNLYIGTHFHNQEKDERTESKREKGGTPQPGDHVPTTATTRASVASIELPAPDMPSHQLPTHHACDNVAGIYHIAMTDILGGVGTGLLQLVINQIDYARRNNLKPWVHMNNSSQVIYDPVVHASGETVTLRSLRLGNASYIRRRGGHWRDAVPGPPIVADRLQDLSFSGTGIWEHYFEPVSDFVPGDHSCERKLFVSMDLYLITPGLHGFSDYATRCWRYEYLPEYITKPHLPYDSWLQEQRIRANEIVQSYIRFKPYLIQAAERANPGCSEREPCLGLHIRHSDKAAGRRLVETKEFLPYAQAFVENGGAYIYLATDSTEVPQEINESWPSNIKRTIRRMGDDTVRSSDTKAVFDIGSHHRTNKEALIEILSLSRCQYMVHGLSAISESSIWINIALHNRSVNLEDPMHIVPGDFGVLVSKGIAGHLGIDFPHATRTDEWWNAVIEDAQAVRSDVADTCDGHQGVLLITTISRTSSAGAAFFTDVLNQLLYAHRNNLKPWVHLQNGTALIDDETTLHQSSIEPSLQRLNGRLIKPSAVDNNPFHVCPTDFFHNKQVGWQETSMTLFGRGIWSKYFAPLRPLDASCSHLPIATMPEQVVAPVLKEQCPYSVKAYRYDLVSDQLWRPQTSSTINTTINTATLNDWMEPMRRDAHEVVTKYYRFRPHLVRQAEVVNPTNTEAGPCLAVHIRVGDKSGKYRAKVSAAKYQPYLEAFERAGGRSIYVASDSHRAIQYMMNSFPARVTGLIRTQGPFVVRTYKEYPTHFIDNHHRVNSETLVDILAMSKCSWIVHSHSTVAEAAIYVNLDLHTNSVNLEDPDRMSPVNFERAIKTTMKGS